MASSNSEVRSAIESNNSKKRGHGKYTPEQMAMIGKRAAEHGVVANLCIPDHLILVVTSYTAFTSKLEATALRVHKGCGLYQLDHDSNHYKSEHPRKFYSSPRKIPAIWYVSNIDHILFFSYSHCHISDSYLVLYKLWQHVTSSRNALFVFCCCIY